MRTSGWIGTAVLVGMTGLAGGYLRFRRELDEIVARLEQGSAVVRTDRGDIEFGRKGEGEPVLLIHGAGGGYDQGLFVGEELFGSGHDIIAPSRFGYLRTPLPADPSPAAQADAHGALLDHLGVDRCIVLGISAGAPSAIELALRYPERVSSLILVVPRTYHPQTEVSTEDTPANRMIIELMEQSADYLYWLAIRFGRAQLVRFFGVPPEIDAKAPPEERERVTTMMRNALPLSKRAEGIRADGLAEISEWPLDRIRVPTLVISVADDLFRTAPGAQYTAERIPGAELKLMDNGGHLMLGRSAEVRALIRDFLGRRPLSRTSRSRCAVVTSGQPRASKRKPVAGNVEVPRERQVR